MENAEIQDSTGDVPKNQVEPETVITRLKDTNKRRIERLEKQILILATYIQAIIDKLQAEEENKTKSGLILPS